MTSELKYHQKCRNKIILNHIPDVLYLSTIPSATELESLKSQISIRSSSAESTPFSSPSHGMMAMPGSVSILKTDFCIKNYYQTASETKILKALREKIGNINIICKYDVEQSNFKKNYNM